MVVDSTTSRLKAHEAEQTVKTTKNTDFIVSVQEYFALFDGKTPKPWSEIQPKFDRLFSLDLKVITSDRDYNYDEWSRFLIVAAQKGGTVKLENLEKVSETTYRYEVVVTVPGELTEAHFTNKFVLGAGEKVVRIEPEDPTAFDSAVKQVLG